MYGYVFQLLNHISNCTKKICMSNNLQHASVFICRIQISYVFSCRLKFNDTCLPAYFPAFKGRAAVPVTSQGPTGLEGNF